MSLCRLHVYGRIEGKDVIMSFSVQKNRKVLIGLSAVLVILIGALLFYFLYWIKTPAYSLGLVPQPARYESRQRI